jgi:hypothetical protein
VAVALPLGRQPGLAVDDLSLGDEGPNDVVDVLLEPHLAAADLAQGGDRPLVVTLDEPRRAGRDLTGALGGQDDQREVVVHTLKTIFDCNSCHVSSLGSRRLPASG